MPDKVIGNVVQEKSIYVKKNPRNATDNIK